MIKQKPPNTPLGGIFAKLFHNFTMTFTTRRMPTAGPIVQN